MFKERTISKIIKDYQNGELTPLDLAKECIKKSEENSKYQMWEAFNPDFLLEQAEIATKRIKDKQVIRPLEGVLVGIKDIYNTIDFPTQMGSSLWKDFTPGNDARTVFYLKQAGAIVAGKTVTAEFAVHELNKTLNPHDIKKTPGTSSSGSAVAVALEIVPAAIGTQTAGSIIRPASFCGVWGCKPSFGTIPRTGMLKTTDSLDTIGYFTIHREDLKIIFDSLRVHGPDYPFSYKALGDNERQNKPISRHWKIGLVKTHTWEYAPDYAKEKMLNFASELSKVKDIDLDEINLPESMINTHKIHESIYNKALSYYFKEESKKSEYVSDIMKTMIEKGNKISVEQYQNALKEQSKLCYEMDDFMQKYDAVICLSTAGEAPDRGTIENPDPSLMWTLTHLPAVNAPIFRSPNNLPFGLQIVSRRYNDYLLFNLLDFLNEQGVL